MFALVIGVLLPWLIVGAGCWVGFQLLRQNGRILLRLEQLERQSASLVALAQAARDGQDSPENTSSQSERARSAPPTELTLGVAAPPFELPGLSGGRTSLAQFRGRRVLLVFFNPQCSFCVQMASDLSALPLDDPGVALPVVVTTDNAAANRRLFDQHETRFPVLLQQHMDVAAAYQANGTPTGYLIDEEGRVASPLAIGAQALLRLARARTDGGPARMASGSSNKVHRGNRSLADSKINRAGLRAGTPAPDFRLQRVGGGELSLAEYRGRRVLLVLSDPHCGPCNQLAPRLEQLHRRVPYVEVLMVSRGDAEENRRKVAEHGLSFPVVLQRQWEISRAYGMFATPIGYLIDEAGVIAADVAQGTEEILALHSRAFTPSQEEGTHGVHVAR